MTARKSSETLWKGKAGAQEATLVDPIRRTKEGLTKEPVGRTAPCLEMGRLWETFTR